MRISSCASRSRSYCIVQKKNYMPEHRYQQYCALARALDVVGDRWTLLLIRDLLGGKKRYGELVASPEKIPTNILADRLKRLEREGLIHRVPYSVHPPRDEYELTLQGRQLGGVLEALAIWGSKHFPGTRRRARAGADHDPPQPR